MSDSIWDNSSYLDASGYGVTTATTPEQAFGIQSSQVSTGTLTMALVLPRLNDPTALLGENWAQREAVLNGLTPAQVGAIYGADPARYAALTAYLSTVPGVTMRTAADGYVSSAQSRTVWVNLDAQAFQTLFGQKLLSGTSSSNTTIQYWDGNLTPNASLGPLAGLWPAGVPAAPATPQDTSAVPLMEGPQGIGNSSGGGYQLQSNTPTDLYPNRIAAEYNFPLAGSNVATPTIGLIETDGSALPDNANQLIQAYRTDAGVSGTGTISEGPDQPLGTEPVTDERSLDVGVVATAAPNSNIVSEAGASGGYTALEEAVWGNGTKLGDLSSSFSLSQRVNPASPFAAALGGLYQDVALNNVSFFQDAFDGGSSDQVATGLPEPDTNVDTYTVTVGGTSTSSQAQVNAAGAADTGGAANINAGIATLAQQAQNGNVAALETLVTGGLTQNPTATSNVASFLQTTWNQYDYNASTQTLSPGYAVNESGGGGVDTAIPEPSYQTNAGIDTQALAQAAGIPNASSGKGDPDVSALAGGNTHYIVPGAQLAGTENNGGTSAATPLWAALTAKIQAVFTDQGLPTTGYFNDLLYTAAAIDPGSFDDVQFGSNTSSFVLNGPVRQSIKPAVGSTTSPGTETITPTGLGYSAGPGYDLATGLGTPNGVLLTRALTQVAQAEFYSPDAPPVTDGTGQTSAANQVLIVQPTLLSGFSGTLAAGGTAFTPASNGSGLGWSARIAQQTLQSTFDPALAQAIAGQSQASSTQITVSNGQALAVSIGGAAATPTAQADTSPFGFVSYTANGQSVTLARPLAVAATYGGQNDTNAIVRVRQDSADADSLSFYRVDNLSGTIGGVAPGQAGYAAAAAARDYTTAGGATAIAGPGDGQFLQTDIMDVNNGDVIGFALTDATSGRTTWGLASQNADGGNKLWSYGADTWGLDDGTAGDDASDSMVFQLDFTSNAGSGLVASDAPVCFVAGTLIQTARGNVAIEALAVGDLVVTSVGVERPTRWLGHRTVDCRRHPRPHEVMPIRVAAHAFGEGRPARELRVSPGHAICVDVVGEVLIPAAALVNGTTIVQEPVESVTYWHVELDGGHDVVFAETLPCESYLDMDNRGFFAETGVTALHALPDARAVTHAAFCRPFHGGGPVVAFVCERLAARSPDLGWRLEEAPFANLHLVVDGRRLEPETNELVARFTVPADAKEVWLVSETSVPAEIGLAPDLRALGVCVSRLVVDDGFGSPRTIAADDPWLCVGFHHLEDGPQRWTAGRARLPAELWHGCRGSFFLRVDLTRPALPRWVAPAANRNAASSKHEG